MRFFWQFKNGAIAQSTPMEIIRVVFGDGSSNVTSIWDRSLGGYVWYER